MKTFRRLPLRLFALLLGASLALPAETLESRALATLTGVLESGPSVEQIHAAEVLIQFGHAAQVHAWLSRDGAQHDATPIYRVIFWRALAGSTTDAAERERYLQRIFAIAATPGAPDRIHAIESAAKLRATVPANLVPMLQNFAATAGELDATFIHWALWSVQPPADPIAALTGWLGSADPFTRLRTAHMLRWLAPLAPEVRDALTAAARAAEEPLLATAIIVGAAALLETSPADHAYWRERLEPLAHGGDPTVAYHALQGLMALYRVKDLPLILPLLDHPHPDVRAGAAWAVLTVDRRGE